MLGQQIADPDRVEVAGSGHGFGLLHLTTVLHSNKITEQVAAQALHLSGMETLPVRGYLIHMGRTQRHEHRPCFELQRRNDESRRSSGTSGLDDQSLDGAVRDDGLVWGTYIHGLFDEPVFRRAWLNRLRIRKGLPVLDFFHSQQVNDTRRDELDRWADHVAQHLDLRVVWALLEGKETA